MIGRSRSLKVAVLSCSINLKGGGESPFLLMILFKRNKDKDDDFNSSYWNGTTRIGYDSKQCYTDEQVKKAKKDGWHDTLRSVEIVTKKRKKRDTEESTESDGSGDSLFGSP